MAAPSWIEATIIASTLSSNKCEAQRVDGRLAQCLFRRALQVDVLI